jgi:uncharacterized membrane protein
MNDPSPPRWAEALLRAVLAPRDRDTIPGDLLEEYREVAFPTLGPARARRWYLRQVWSLMAITTTSLVVRMTLLWAAAFVAVMLVRIVVDALVPEDIVAFFLAQSRDDFSQLDYPRRWLPVLAVAAVFTGAGFQVAWETGRIRIGVLVAIAVAAVGFFGTTLIVSISRVASIEISGGLYSAFALDQHSPRFTLFVALLVLGAALGTVGAIAARGLSRAGLQQRAAI